MTAEQTKAIAAFAQLQTLGTIVITPEHWWTPKGKRVARSVGCTRGRVIRWYVGGRLFHQLAINAENVAMSKRWAAA